jgi:hypothetical protein
MKVKLIYDLGYYAPYVERRYKTMNEWKVKLLTDTMQSMTNITPDEDKILKIEDLRMDFKNLSSKIINLGNHPRNTTLAIRHLEDALYRSLKSILMEVPTVEQSKKEI